MSETANLSNQEAQGSQPETISTDSLKTQIEDFAQKLGLNLNREMLPRALTIGAPKEIAGARIPELFKTLTELEKEFNENAEGLKLAAGDIETTVEDLVSNPIFINAWRIKMQQQKLSDLIAELKSILNLYCEHLARLATKKENAPSAKFEKQFEEIPKPATGYEALSKALKQTFLSKMGVTERDDLRGESPEEIAKTAVSKTVWEDFFDDTKKNLEEKLPTAKKRLEVLKMLAGEAEKTAFSFDITINSALLSIVDDETAFLILENYLKARMVASIGFDQKENIENFWDLISILQVLQNPSSHKKTSAGIVIKRYESLPELQEKDDGDSESKHEKTFRRNVTKRHIKEQRECAAQQAELLNRIEAVVAFLSEVTKDKKIKNFGNASHICQRCDIKKTENGVFYSEKITAEQAKAEKDSFDRRLRENFDSRRHDRTLQPQAEVNLIDRANELIRTARAAALQAIEEARTAQAATEADRERSRKSAKEAWSRVAEIQRRLDKALTDNEQLNGEIRQLTVQFGVQTETLQRLEATIKNIRDKLTAALANPGTFGGELKTAVENLLRNL